MAKTKKPIVNWYRAPLQWLVLAGVAYTLLRPFVDPAYLTDIEAWCPYGGMQAYASLLVNNSLACNMSGSQIAMGLLLLAGVFAFSKLFCSFACPVGTFTEWLGRIARKRKLQYTITGIADRGLRILKYGLLFLSFYFTVESSELFCRTFDPYYAVFSGFNQDVVFWYALPAILITVLGSLFLRQFWCKYLCPLSAASNLMTNIAVVVGLGILFAVLALSGVSVSWIWILAVVCVTGFLVETATLRGWVVPGLKITRNTNICSGCKKCDKACPMAIPISEVLTVTHVDCHLCTDCIGVCPDKGSLGINRREMRWAPPAATIVLVAAGFVFSANVEVPTIDQRWGTESQMQSAAVYVQSGLMSIKCFGSSSSFAERMRALDGVLGVKTFAKSHTINVWYDPAKLTPSKIREFMFTPARQLLSVPPAEAVVGCAELGVDKLFDGVDEDNFASIMSQAKGIYAFESHFGEPVSVTIYFDPENWSAEKLKALIENPRTGLTRRNKQDVHIDFSFPVRYAHALPQSSGVEVQKNFFEPFETTANDFEKLDPANLSVIEIPFPQALDPVLVEELPYLSSHVTGDPGVVRIETAFVTGPILRVSYLPRKTTPDRIRALLKSPTLSVLYESGRTEEMPNPFVK